MKKNSFSNVIYISKIMHYHIQYYYKYQAYKSIIDNVQLDLIFFLKIELNRYE